MAGRFLGVAYISIIIIRLVRLTSPALRDRRVVLSPEGVVVIRLVRHFSSASRPSGSTLARRRSGY